MSCVQPLIDPAHVRVDDEQRHAASLVADGLLDLGAEGAVFPFGAAQAADHEVVQLSSR